VARKLDGPPWWERGISGKGGAGLPIAGQRPALRGNLWLFPVQKATPCAHRAVEFPPIPAIKPPPPTSGAGVIHRGGKSGLRWWGRAGEVADGPLGPEDPGAGSIPGTPSKAGAGHLWALERPNLGGLCAPTNRPRLADQAISVRSLAVPIGPARPSKGDVPARLYWNRSSPGPRWLGWGPQETIFGRGNRADLHCPGHSAKAGQGGLRRRKSLRGRLSGHPRKGDSGGWDRPKLRARTIEGPWQKIGCLRAEGKILGWPLGPSRREPAWSWEAGIILERGGPR